MSKSASLPIQPFEPESNDTAAHAPAWKQEVNQRLAAHRTRRGGQDAQDARAEENARPATGRAAEAAARVAARYAKAPSYSQLLAGEARAVVRAAGAAAEAALNAQAAAEAVLAGLEAGPLAQGRWEKAESQSDFKVKALPPAAQLPQAQQPAPSRWLDEPPAATQATAQQSVPWAGAQPRWEEALPVTAPAPPAGSDVWSEMRVHGYGAKAASDSGRGAHEEDLFAADFYDSFDPVGSVTVEPITHLPANLIEFPRELVATRKARPRLAEGPFYDDSHESSQLNIFEVDPDLLAPPVSLGETKAAEVAPPEWASIELDHHPKHDHEREAYPEHVYANPASIETVGYDELSQMPGNAVEEMPTEVEAVAPTGAEVEVGRRLPQVAAQSAARPSAPPAELLVAQLSDRLLAGVVDGALVTLAFLAAAVVVIASTDHPPSGRAAAIASAVGLILFAMLYQFLFLSYAEEGTPGMRYARIALCTFEDDNPTRQQMQMRIPALLVSAVPAGLGMLWAVFDGDHLGWHDRMTRTYQRKY